MDHDETVKKQLKTIIEALLFASAEPVTVQKIKQVLSGVCPIGTADVRALIEELQEEYRLQERAFGLEAIAEGYILRTKPEFHPYVLELTKNPKKERLSHSSLETLAIIAYKQPITRAEIEEIRGVDSSGTVAHLQERCLVEVVGKLEVPGRPTTLGTTKEFLKRFGLNDIADLPPIASQKGTLDLLFQ